MITKYPDEGVPLADFVPEEDRIVCIGLCREALKKTVEIYDGKESDVSATTVAEILLPRMERYNMFSHTLTEAQKLKICANLIVATYKTAMEIGHIPDIPIGEPPNVC